MGSGDGVALLGAHVVVGEEDLLQRRRPAVQPADPGREQSRRAPRRRCAGHRDPHAAAASARPSTTPGTRRGRGRVRPARLEDRRGRCRRSSSRAATSTSRPARRMADPVADVLDLVEQVRGQEDRLPRPSTPRAPAPGTPPPSAGRGPTVGSSRSRSSGRVMNAAIRATFCRLPLEYARTRRRRSRSKRSTSSSRNASSTPPDTLPSRCRVSRPGELRPQRHVAGHVGQGAVRPLHVLDRDPAQPGRPRRWDGSGRAAAGSSSTCRRRWARGSRRPRRAPPSGRGRRGPGRRRSASSGPACGSSVRPRDLLEQPVRPR